MFRSRFILCLTPHFLTSVYYRLEHALPSFSTEGEDIPILKQAPPFGFLQT